MNETENQILGRLFAVSLIMLMLVLTAWGTKEYQRGQVQIKNAARQTAELTAKAVMSGISVFEPEEIPARLPALLHAIQTTTGVAFLCCRLRDGRLWKTGKLPDKLPKHLAQNQSTRRGNTFIFATGGDWNGDGYDAPPAFAANAPWPAIVLIGIRADPLQKWQKTAKARLLLVGLVWLIALTMGELIRRAIQRSRKLSQSLDDTHRRAEQLEEFNLAAVGIAHETKNPLGIIRGQAQRIMENDDLPEELHQLTEQMIEEVDATTSRISHFLAYARTRTPEIQETDLPGEIKKVISMLEDEAAETGINLNYEGTEDLTILADPRMLRQILLNLMLNSLQAGEKGDYIILRSGIMETAFFEIIDSGKGIPPELLTKVFSPYVTGRPDGHGLGLAVVRRIVAAHNWQIHLQSQVKRGTEIRVDGIFPVTRKNKANK